MSIKKSFETIQAGWLIDGSGDDVQKDVFLDVCNGFLRSIRNAKRNRVESDKPVNFSGHTLLPCLVDSHVHLFMSGSDHSTVRSHQLEAPFAEIKKTISGHITENLLHGVIAVRDGGDRQAHALRYKIECPYLHETPFQLRVAGRAWHRSGRYGKLIGRTPAANSTLAGSIESEKMKIDHVKIVNSGLNSLIRFGHQTAPQFGLDEMKKAVKAARRLNLPVMVHANGRLPVAVAVDAECHSVEHGFFMGTENLKKMAEKNIFWVPTAATMQAYSGYLKRIGENSDVARRNLDHQIGQLAAARKLGVPIAVGTDAGSLGVQHGVSVADELKILLMANFSIEQAIQCATSNSARLLGLEESFLLKAGMPATFIVVKGAPSLLPDSLYTVEQVYIRGRRYASGDNLTGLSAGKSQ